TAQGQDRVERVCLRRRQLVPRLVGKERVHALDPLHLRPDADLLFCRGVVGAAHLGIDSDDVLLAYGLVRKGEAKRAASALADDRTDVPNGSFVHGRPSRLTNPGHTETPKPGDGRSNPGATCKWSGQGYGASPGR